MTIIFPFPQNSINSLYRRENQIIFYFLQYDGTLSQLPIIGLLILSPEEASHTQNLYITHTYLEASNLKSPSKHTSITVRAKL